MKLQTDFSNTLQDPLFKILKETVDEVDVEAYVIGGFVRDLIGMRMSSMLIYM